MMRNLLVTVTLSLATALCMAQEAARPAASTLKPPKAAVLPVDARGFIQRWLVLEPVTVAGRLTQSAVEEALQLAALPGTADVFPAAPPVSVPYSPNP